MISQFVHLAEWREGAHELGAAAIASMMLRRFVVSVSFSHFAIPKWLLAGRGTQGGHIYSNEVFNDGTAIMEQIFFLLTVASDTFAGSMSHFKGRIAMIILIPHFRYSRPRRLDTLQFASNVQNKNPAEYGYNLPLHIERWVIGQFRLVYFSKYPQFESRKCSHFLPHKTNIGFGAGDLNNFSWFAYSNNT